MEQLELDHEEQVILAKHWVHVSLVSEYVWFETKDHFNTHANIWDHASCRLGEIAGAIGEDEVTEIVRNVQLDFARTVGPQAWLNFLVDSKNEEDRTTRRLRALSPASDETKPVTKLELSPAVEEAPSFVTGSGRV